MNHCLPFDQRRLLPTNIHYQYFPFDYFLCTQKELGFTSIDLVTMPPHVWINDRNHEDLAQLRNMILDAGLDTAVVTPESATLRFILNATDTERRQRSMQYYKNCLTAAQELGAKILAITMSGAFWDESPVFAQARAIDTLRALCLEAEKSGVTIAVETAPVGSEVTLCTLQELKTVLQSVNHPLLKATLDTVAMSEAGETITQWFTELPQQIAYVRFADGRAGGGHYVWGTGVYPVERYLTELAASGYRGNLGLKVNLAAYSQHPVQADTQNLQALRPYLQDCEVRSNAIG